MSYSWPEFISQMKIWMFNVSVPDNYMPVCHSSMKDLGTTSQKDIFYFTTLKGDYHLTASWCCVNNSKSPTFMSPHMLRANACNGGLVSQLDESSNLTGKNSYCVLTTGHHRCILTKYRTGLGKLYTLPFHPLRLHLLPEALMSRTTCFQETPPRPTLTTPKVILCLEEGYIFVGRSWKKDPVWGLPCLHPNHTRGNWAIAQLIPNPEHISFWNTTIIQQTEFSQ
jgi:hypothetical protein